MLEQRCSRRPGPRSPGVGETFDPVGATTVRRGSRSSSPGDVPRGLRKGMSVVHVALLIGCAVAIYLACEWFVNAVEWLGVRLKMGTLAIGTILAAIGTALPESVVTLVAVTMRHSAASKDIGVGAAMGGPLVLATIAYGVTGWMLIRRKRSLTLSGGDRSRELLDEVDLSRLPTDQ